MATTLRDFIHDLPREEQETIARRAFELRSALADLKGFDRIMDRKTGVPVREADRPD